MKQLLHAALVALAFATSAHAAGSDYAEAMRVRRLIQCDPASVRARAAVTLSLPVSRGFDQRHTSLCWAYATLNGLETRARVLDPGDTLELSRRTLQVLTMRDRWTRKIRGTESYIGERGVAVDAMRLISESGLVAFADFTDVADPYGSFSIAGAVNAASGVDAKLRALEGGLTRVYGVPPAETHLGLSVVTPSALAGAVVGDAVWESYAVATTGEEGWRQHPDPDARAGVKSYFLAREKLVARVRAALEAGHPVELTIGGHCVLIRGAAYGADGSPVGYDIKDSYPGYFYTADPASVMRNLVEVTTRRL